LTQLPLQHSAGEEQAEALAVQHIPPNDVGAHSSPEQQNECDVAQPIVAAVQEQRPSAPQAPLQQPAPSDDAHLVPGAMQQVPSPAPQT
jgi:hypothetical protein